MNGTSDNDLRDLFSGRDDRYHDEAFVTRVHQRIRRARLRSRILGWSAGIAFAVLVGLASPWLIQASQIASTTLGLAFDGVRNFAGSVPLYALVGIAVVIFFGASRQLR